MFKKTFAFILGLFCIYISLNIFIKYDFFLDKEIYSFSFLKLENENQDNEIFYYSIKNLIKEVKISSNYCDGKKNKSTKWIEICFDRKNKDIPFEDIYIEVSLYTIGKASNFPFKYYINSLKENDEINHCNDINSMCQYISIKNPQEKINKNYSYARQFNVFEDVINKKIDKIIIKLKDKVDSHKTLLTKEFIYKRTSLFKKEFKEVF
tara:strand:+ start:3862 stop:4485 length:624 start_codon:yes stop_codon:yes gene_type:complete